MDFLFSLIIYPLKFILEFSFSLFYHVFKNPGIAIFGVSLAVTLMCLPLYIVAESWETKERNIQASMKAGIARIKKYFSGDERFMILNTYYRQNNYHPMMALRSSFSLLIQIPFFMAAYSYLSHLSLLNGESFFLIKDLGQPDALLHFGTFNINVLPVLMTLINCASGFVYSKGHGIREKLQIYIMAVLFLFILYDSPSGLVVYWTLNQVFSFLKNLFFKFKNPGKVLYICLAAGIIFVDFYVLFIHGGSFARRSAMAVCCTLLLFIPLFISIIKKLLNTWFKPLAEENSKRNVIFLSSVVILALLTGMVIPAGIISSSVVEFANIDSYGNPSAFIWKNLFQSAGLFIFWPVCVYFLFGNKIKAIMALLFSGCTLAALVNTFAFVGHYGTLSRLLTFDASIAGTMSILIQLANLLVMLILFAAVMFLIKKNLLSILTAILSISLFSCAALGIVNTFMINSEYKNISSADSLNENTLAPKLHLSKDGKNVVVFMMDRMESAFFDSIFEEDTSLKDIYTGFTLYPNTISFGGHTIIGAPPLFGGYEYTPLEFNKRNDAKKLQKHNEALRLMPEIFGSQLDYNVMVADSSWANYSWIADMSIFEGMKNVSPLSLEFAYTGLWMQKNQEKVRQNIVSNSIKRNLLWLSVFRSSPMIVRDLIYDDGLWWNTDKSSGDVQEFIDFYAALDYLPELTDFSSEKNSFICVTNDTTHSGFELNPPDYVPAIKITGKGTGKYSAVSGYSGNMAAFKLLGEWITLLKKNDCYDNTRIIIVSDHGIGKTEVLESYSGNFDSVFNRDHLNPILFVKDFGATGDIKKDFTFMTNADTPLIALKDLVDSPVNPFTGKVLTDEIKHKTGAVVTTNSTWSPDQHGLYTFKISDDEWFTVKDNIFDSSNWKKGKPE